MCECWCQNGKCATRTKARVTWKVVLYFSNRASICSHALILLSPSRWFVMTGWRTSSCLCSIISLQPFDQNTFGLWSLLITSIVSTLCFKHVWNVDPCLRTRIVSSTVFQTRLVMVLCLGTIICPILPWSNTFGCWFLVVDLCLGTHIRLKPGSNTFDYVACLSTLPPAPW